MVRRNPPQREPVATTVQNETITFGESLVAVDLDPMRREDMGAAVGHQLPMRFAVDERCDCGSSLRGTVTADVIFAVIFPKGGHVLRTARVSERTIAGNKIADRLDILKTRQPLLEISCHALPTGRRGGRKSCSRRG